MIHFYILDFKEGVFYMKDRVQLISMGTIMILTIVLIINVFAARTKMETKASEGESEVVVKKETIEIEEPVFAASENSYFDDALFIGDSRTVGLCEYGTLGNADYFASTGMSIYELWNETLSVENVGKVTLDELLGIKQYGKIYIMLGINELGYNVDQTVAKNEMTIEKIREKQSEAIIYICGNLHVTKARSDKGDYINNEKIDVFNQRLKELTDTEGIYYIDVNEEFDDESGNLRSECTGDDVHVYAKYYQDWCKWLCENTVQRGKEQHDTK